MSKTINKLNSRVWVLCLSLLALLVASVQPAFGQTGFAGRWTMEWQGNGVGTLTLTESGKSLSGSFSTKLINGKVFGTVTMTNSGAMFNGRWTSSRRSGLARFYLARDGTTFQGNADGTRAWCGWRSDAEKPDPCLRPTTATTTLRRP